MWGVGESVRGCAGEDRYLQRPKVELVELELSVIVSHGLVWLLGTQLPFSTRAVNTLNR